MSYEGHEQHFCSNGHYFETGAVYEIEPSEVKCNYCDAKSAWVNYVDDTNCNAIGEINLKEFDKLLISEAKYEVCNLGHNHLIKPDVYRIPTSKDIFIKAGHV